MQSFIVRQRETVWQDSNLAEHREKIREVYTLVSGPNPDIIKAFNDLGTGYVIVYTEDYASAFEPFMLMMKECDKNAASEFKESQRKRAEEMCRIQKDLETILNENECLRHELKRFREDGREGRCDDECECECHN